MHITLTDVLYQFPSVPPSTHPPCRIYFDARLWGGVWVLQNIARMWGERSLGGDGWGCGGCLSWGGEVGGKVSLNGAVDG